MEQLKALIEKAKSDKELMSKLDALGAKDAGDDKIIALAKEYGFTVTADEIEKLKSENADSAGNNEITEDKLEAVAGGGGSENRYDPNTCKNMTRTKYECVGFLASTWCDHYRKELYSKPVPHESKTWLYYHRCVMEAYPRYSGLSEGTPKGR